MFVPPCQVLRGATCPWLLLGNILHFILLLPFQRQPRPTNGKIHGYPATSISSRSREGSDVPESWQEEAPTQGCDSCFGGSPVKSGDVWMHPLGKSGSKTARSTHNPADLGGAGMHPLGCGDVPAVDGCEIHFAPPKKPWNDDSPANTTNDGVSWFQSGAKWISSISRTSPTQRHPEPKRPLLSGTLYPWLFLPRVAMPRVAHFGHVEEQHSPANLGDPLAKRSFFEMYPVMKPANRWL